MGKTLMCIGLLTVAVAFAADAAAGDYVPLKGKDTTSVEVVQGSGSTIMATAQGVGTLTHLGNFTMVVTQTSDLATLIITNGRVTLTAANGDTVTATFSGMLQPGLVGYRVSGPITGGTGRFAGATGEIAFDGTLDPATFTGSDVISGTISTVGST
jgi:hypothetical protein